ncbi:MAG: response regulator transcription factor [Polyangiaceae bacterium]
MRAALAVPTIVVDDHDLFRAGLRALLAATDDVRVVGEARTARQAYDLVDELRPGLAIVDVSLGATDGVAVAAELVRRAAGCHILMLTMHAMPDCVVRALQAGALGYALKDEPVEATLEAVRATAAGLRYLSPRLPVGVIEAHLRSRRGDEAGEAHRSPLDGLSRRERELFEMVVRGLANRQIATELCISVKTVETHRAHINKKLGVHSGVELVRLAALYGAVVP